MSFLLDGLEDTEQFGRCYTDRHLMRRIADHLYVKLPVLSSIVVLTVLHSLILIALPILIASGIDRLEETITIQQTLVLISAMIISGIFVWILNLIKQRFTAELVGDLVLRLRKDTFAAAMAQDMSFYDEHPRGVIISRLTSDTQAFATVITLASGVASDLLLIIFITAVLSSINFYLTILTLLIAASIVTVALCFRRIARQTSAQVQQTYADVTAYVQESIGGISTIKNFRQEQALYDRFIQINEQRRRSLRRLGTLFSGIFPFLITVTGIGTAIIVYFGGQDVVNGHISIGEWFLFIESIAIFWFPLTGIASFWSQFQQGLAASVRVFGLIDADARVEQFDAKPVAKLSGHIQFKQVNFRYTSRETVLENFDLTIEVGETIALVGHTGAGKSSIAKLLARFYEFQGGQILIDQQDVRSFDLSTYGQHFGIVSQVPILFSGTVADNIRYPRPQATDEEVIAAAHQIAGGDWIETLPQGLQTPVEELGRNLSLGQRQLIALARVWLQDPAILVLDEATASVDPLTEAQIQEGLGVLLQNRTAIIIAHRLPTIKKADRIIVLQQGKIIEEGNHQTLLLHQGHYAELYNTYFRHQQPDYDAMHDTELQPVYTHAYIPVNGHLTAEVS